MHERDQAHTWIARALETDRIVCLNRTKNRVSWKQSSFKEAFAFDETCTGFGTRHMQGPGVHAVLILIYTHDMHVHGTWGAISLDPSRIFIMIIIMIIIIAPYTALRKRAHLVSWLKYEELNSDFRTQYTCINIYICMVFVFLCLVIVSGCFVWEFSCVCCKWLL